MKCRYLVLGGLVALVAVYLLKALYLWPESYVVIRPTAIYAENYDALRNVKPIGYTKPGERCRLIDFGDKGLPMPKVRCPSIEGWVDEPRAFDPPLAG